MYARTVATLVILAFLAGIMVPVPSPFAADAVLSDVPPGREPFTVALIPDTQAYVEIDPSLFYAQTRWILGMKREHNAVFAIHLGDVVQTNAEAEWDIADTAFRMLDGAVPYLVAVGNHDMGRNGSADTRDTARFNEHFGPQRFAKRTWYGGHFGNTNENAYAFFRAGGMDFMVLTLEFGPRDEVLAWANAVVAAHPNHRVIVATHAYLGPEPKRLSDEYRVHNPTNYVCCEHGNDGEGIWQEFVRTHRNIFMVVSGHEFKPIRDGVYDPPAGYAVSRGDAGNTVYEFAANYQTVGMSWMRMMRFDPEENVIAVTARTPLRSGEFTDAYDELTQRQYFDEAPDGFKYQESSQGQSFTLSYDMTLP